MKYSGSFRVCLQGIRFFAIVAWLFSFEQAQAWQTENLRAESELLFVRRIKPLLNEKCNACHGNDAKEIKGGLDLRTQAAALRGGDSRQPAIIRGNFAKSPLYLAATRQSDDWSAMPPKEADKLNAEQMEWIRKWIVGGAPWPTDERQTEILKEHAQEWSAEDGIIAKTSGGLSSDWTQRKYKLDGLWAYQPVKKPPVPAGVHAIDALLAARMPTGLKSASTAERNTLIRRATFDLTGLPPTPEEVVTFVNDSRSDAEAFAKVIDRLLASPHYGERMAQHWLDVVRYADSSGFANDYERGNAWRYRDYVVRAFNADKPYDQFIREQIAGDELDPTNPEFIIATGFLRMGPWELTGMEVPKIARQRFLDDVVNSVGETFLAHALQCARCHDHKFDPVPTRDYYSIQAVFATTQLAEREAPFLPTENTAGFDERKYIEQKRSEYQRVMQSLDAVLLRNAEKWFTENGKDATRWKGVVKKMLGTENLDEDHESTEGFRKVRAELVRQGVSEDDLPPKLVGFLPEHFGMERVARKGLERLKWELERYEPFALAVYSGKTPDIKSVYAPLRMPSNPLDKGELEESHILTGGDPFSLGAKVQPGILSICDPTDLAKIPETFTGRRRAFAEWLTSAEHPLTARVIANRVWLWHFNQPLAGNPNNFGSTGKRPTHPELLDWLAATFVDDGWSFKNLHRSIMTSEAYRRCTLHSEPKLLRELDPNGVSYAVFTPRRLSGEELRDSMLLATGELNRTLGGIPNRPEINREAALQPRQVMGTFAAAWTPNPLPAQRHRRSLYALKLRGLSDPMLEVFNSPAPDFSCERREASTVTPQVFSLFNGQNTHARALALAQRVIKETKTDAAAIERCFQLVLSRKPTEAEVRLCRAHWVDIEQLLNRANDSPTEYQPPLEVRREAVEENTGEKFSFREVLHANADFVPDLQPSEVSVHVRALADVCLVLFNSNEFAYVY